MCTHPQLVLYHNDDDDDDDGDDDGLVCRRLFIEPLPMGNVQCIHSMYGSMCVVSSLSLWTTVCGGMW